MTNEWVQNIDWEREPLYLEIARALTEWISTGRLKPGDLLPTHRHLASELGVAIGTVTRAYTEVEQQGLIHGRGRRGTIVGKSRKGKESLTSLLIPGQSVINLSINYPSVAQDPDILPVLRRMSRMPTSQQLLRYQDEPDLMRYCVAGAAWVKGLGLEVKPDSIILTAGAQHGLNVIFLTVAEPGDVILTEELSYPGIKAIADMLKLRLIGVPMDNHGMLPDAVESLCRTSKVRALYTIPTLQNPTNCILPESRKKAIAAIADKYDFAIVEDEIHRCLIRNPPPLFAEIAPHRTYLIASTSKVVAGGLRVGFLLGPSEAKKKLLQTLRASAWMVSLLTFEIFSIWMDDGTVDDIIIRRRRESHARHGLACELLGQYSMNSHPASYFLWLRLPEGWTQTQFSMEAYRQGVAVAPAETFAVQEKEASHAVRVCYVTPENREILQVGLERLGQILEGRPTAFSAAL